MTGSLIEATLELWTSSLREVRARMRPLFTQERVTVSAGQFLDGLLDRQSGVQSTTLVLKVDRESVADGLT